MRALALNNSSYTIYIILFTVPVALSVSGSRMARWFSRPRDSSSRIRDTVNDDPPMSENSPVTMFLMAWAVQVTKLVELSHTQ